MQNALWSTVYQVTSTSLADGVACARSAWPKSALLVFVSCQQFTLDRAAWNLGLRSCCRWTCSDIPTPCANINPCASNCCQGEGGWAGKRERAIVSAEWSARCPAMGSYEGQRLQGQYKMWRAVAWSPFISGSCNCFRGSAWMNAMQCVWSPRRQLLLDFNEQRMASSTLYYDGVVRNGENSCTAANGRLGKDVRHIMTSLKALPNRRCLENKKGWELLTGPLLAVAPHLTPKDIAAVLNYCRQAQYLNRELLKEVALSVYRRNLLAEFEQWQLAVSIHALGALARDQQKGITWSIGTDKVGRNQSALLKSFAANLMEESTQRHRLQRFKSSQLANIVYGTVFLDIKETYAQKCLCKEAAKQEHLRKFKTAELSLLVWSWGKLGYCDRSTLPILMQEVLRPERLQRFHGHELSTMLQGLALLSTKLAECFSQQDSRKVCQEFVAEIQHPKRLAQYTARSLASIICALGKLQYMEGAVVSALVEEALKSHRLAEFDAACFSNLLYGLASLEPQLRCGMRESKIVRVVEILVGEAGKPECLAQYNTQNRANIAWALAKLRFLDERLLRGLLPTSTSCDRQCSAEEYRMLLHACATFNAHDDAFLAQFADYMLENVKSLQYPWETTTVLLDLSTLDALGVAHFQQLVSHLCHLLGVGGHMSAGCCSRLFLAWLHIATCHRDIQLSATARDVIEKARVEYTQQHASISSFHRQVSDALVDLGVGHDCCVVVDGSIVADIVLDENWGKRVIVEVDGPSHYTINKQEGEYQMMGNTVFRNKILDKLNWQVISVPFFKWYHLPSEAQKEWLREQLANGLTPKTC